jgi:hypothetical protein
MSFTNSRSFRLKLLHSVWFHHNFIVPQVTRGSFPTVKWQGDTYEQSSPADAEAEIPGAVPPLLHMHTLAQGRFTFSGLFVVINNHFSGIK